MRLVLLLRLFVQATLILSSLASNNNNNTTVQPGSVLISIPPLFSRKSGFGSREKGKSYVTSLVNIFYSLPMVQRIIYEDSRNMLKNQETKNELTNSLAHKFAAMRIFLQNLHQEDAILSAMEKVSNEKYDFKGIFQMNDFFSKFIHAQSPNIRSLFTLVFQTQSEKKDLKSWSVIVPMDKGELSLSEVANVISNPSNTAQIISIPEVLAFSLDRFEISGKNRSQTIKLISTPIIFDQELSFCGIPYIFAGNVEGVFSEAEYLARVRDFGNFKYYKYFADGIAFESDQHILKDTTSVLAFYVKKESITRLRDSAEIMDSIRNKNDIPRFILEKYNYPVRADHPDPQSPIFPSAIRNVPNARNVPASLQNDVVNNDLQKHSNDIVITSNNISSVGIEAAVNTQNTLNLPSIAGSSTLKKRKLESFDDSDVEFIRVQRADTQWLNKSTAASNSLPNETFEILSRLINPNFELGNPEYSFENRNPYTPGTAVQLVLSLMADSPAIVSFYFTLLNSRTGYRHLDFLVAKVLTQMLLGMRNISVVDLIEEIYNMKTLPMRSFTDYNNIEVVSKVIKIIMESMASGIFDGMTVSTIKYNGMDTDDPVEIYHGKHYDLKANCSIPFRPTICDGVYADVVDQRRNGRNRFIFKSPSLMIPVFLSRTFEEDQNGNAKLVPDAAIFGISSSFDVAAAFCFAEGSFKSFQAWIYNNPRLKIRHFRPGQLSETTSIADINNTSNDFSRNSFLLFFTQFKLKDFKIITSSQIPENVRSDIIKNLTLESNQNK